MPAAGDPRVRRSGRERLNIHDVIHISAIKFAGNVKPMFDTDEAVVSVLPPTVEAAPVAAAAEAARSRVSQPKRVPRARRRHRGG